LKTATRTSTATCWPNTVDDLRRLSLALPGAHEVAYKGSPWFNVGSKTFALIWNDRIVLKLDKTHQEFLFEVRPETFQTCPVATRYWSYVDIDRLDDAEFADLVFEAWSTVVPKKVSRAYLAQT
jgi:hypothetical protein